MRKGFVALLLVLALVVLVSPGIIGRLAEQSMDENINWAVDERNEFAVTELQFQRGWFSSEGRHRVALLDGELQSLLLPALSDGDTMPVLIVDTRLDHGLIPVSSMLRERGSLFPGLGSAVSRLSIERGDGAVVPLPGRLFSRVGLGGGVTANFLLEPGGFDRDSGRIDWGGADFLVTSNPVRGDFTVVGTQSSLAIEAPQETMIVGELNVDIDLGASVYGFMTGTTRVSLESFAVIGIDDTMAAGPMRIWSQSGIDNGRLRAVLDLQIDDAPIPAFGSSSMRMSARLENVDADLFGRLQRSLQAYVNGNVVLQDAAEIERDAQRLLAAGMELHFDQLDFTLPMGQVASRISAKVLRSGDGDYTWATALLNLDASADVSLPAALVDMMTQANPDMHSAIAMGFLRKKGDVYVMNAAFKQGLLTVNGAPMPVPLPGVR